MKPDDKQLPLFEIDTSEESKWTESSIPESLPGEEGESPFSNYIVYVDESGDHAMQTIDGQYPLFVLAFCVFHKRYYSERVVSALEKFKFNHFGHDQVVLHENGAIQHIPQPNAAKSFPGRVNGTYRPQ